MALLILSAWLYPRDFRRAWRNAAPLLVLAGVLAAYQYTWTAACFGSNPTGAQFISKIGLVPVILFSFAIFRDERAQSFDASNISLAQCYVCLG